MCYAFAFRATEQQDVSAPPQWRGIFSCRMEGRRNGASLFIEEPNGINSPYLVSICSANSQLRIATGVLQSWICEVRTVLRSTETPHPRARLRSNRISLHPSTLGRDLAAPAPRAAEPWPGRDSWVCKPTMLHAINSCFHSFLCAKQISRSPYRAHADCVTASDTALSIPCQSGRATAALYADRHQPKVTTSQMSL